MNIKLLQICQNLYEVPLCCIRFELGSHGSQIQNTLHYKPPPIYHSYIYALKPHCIYSPTITDGCRPILIFQSTKIIERIPDPPNMIYGDTCRALWLYIVSEVLQCSAIVLNSCVTLYCDVYTGVDVELVILIIKCIVCVLINIFFAFQILNLSYCL